MLNLSFYMYTCGLVVFCLFRKHLLLLLLSLEFIVMSLFFMFSLFLSTFELEGFILMVFMSFSVCEGALGLSVLVSMVRFYGNDYFFSMNTLW